MNPYEKEINLIQVMDQKQSHLSNENFICIPTCRICLMQMNASEILTPCLCKGSNACIHQNCLVEWLKRSKPYQDSYTTYFSICEICKGRIFLTTKTHFRCITRQQVKVELFQKHICCTIVTIIFLFLALIVMAIIIYVGSFGSTSAETVLYSVGITVTGIIILITLVVYVFYFVVKNDVEVLGIDRKRIRQAQNNQLKVRRKNPKRIAPLEAQDTYINQFLTNNQNFDMNMFAQRI